MSRQRSGPLLFHGSFVLALLLGLLPQPDMLAGLKPYWLGLVLLYWALEAPERIGLGAAFVIGLLADLGSLFLGRLHHAFDVVPDFLGSDFGIALHRPGCRTGIVLDRARRL